MNVCLKNFWLCLKNLNILNVLKQPSILELLLLEILEFNILINFKIKQFLHLIWFTV